LTKIEAFNNNLKEKNIRFEFWQLSKYRHFIKHIDYEAENEYRLWESNKKPNGWFINRDNGILTPYIEKSLKVSDRNEYQFQLDEIILGPAMPEVKVNVMQVFYMICQNDSYNFSVSTSRINSYR